MQEIILFAVLALIIGAMLFSVLGKDIGHGSDDPIDPSKLNMDMGSKSNSTNGTIVDAVSQGPTFSGPGADGLTSIYEADPSFSQSQFMDGAKAAYGMILEAYADGDRDTLKGLLNASVFKDYVGAIDDREEKNLSQTTDLARLMKAEIVAASKIGKTASISVFYRAELATALLNAEDEVVSGDLDVLSRVEEVWQYERVIGHKNPNWVLCSVAPHDVLEGDTGGPDHSPDTV